MKILKNTNLAGRNITTVFDNKYCIEKVVNGQCFSDRDVIVLEDYKKSDISRATSEVAYIHENLHKMNNILGKMGTECDSEEYVTPIAELIHQFILQIEDKK